MKPVALFVQEKTAFVALVAAVSLSVSFTHGVLASAVMLIVLPTAVMVVDSEDEQLLISVTVTV